jgi:hypothetical protein
MKRRRGGRDRSVHFLKVSEGKAHGEERRIWAKEQSLTALDDWCAVDVEEDLAV